MRGGICAACALRVLAVLYTSDSALVRGDPVRCACSAFFYSTDGRLKNHPPLSYMLLKLNTFSSEASARFKPRRTPGLSFVSLGYPFRLADDAGQID